MNTAEMKSFSLMIIGKECPLDDFEVESKGSQSYICDRELSKVLKVKFIKRNACEITALRPICVQRTLKFLSVHL